MAEGQIGIEFERDLVEPVADHIAALINEVLEPFKASVSWKVLPVAHVPPVEYKNPEILGG